MSIETYRGIGRLCNDSETRQMADIEDIFDTASSFFFLYHGYTDALHQKNRSVLLTTKRSTDVGFHLGQQPLYVETRLKELEEHQVILHHTAVHAISQKELATTISTVQHLHKSNGDTIPFSGDFMRKIRGSFPPKKTGVAKLSDIEVSAAEIHRTPTSDRVRPILPSFDEETNPGARLWKIKVHSPPAKDTPEETSTSLLSIKPSSQDTQETKRPPLPIPSPSAQYSEMTRWEDSLDDDSAEDATVNININDLLHHFENMEQEEQEESLSESSTDAEGTSPELNPELSLSLESGSVAMHYESTFLESFEELSTLTFEGLYIHDNGKVLAVNQAAAEILHTERSKLIGRNLIEFAAPECHQAVYTYLQQQGGEPRDIVGIRDDGSRFFVEFRGKTITYRGKDLRIIAFHDVTNRKVAEMALRDMNEELERRVRERTAKLDESNKALQASMLELKRTSEQLLESEKMAALGGLVAGVAHEMNTPLGVAITAASLLEDKAGGFIEKYTTQQVKRSQLQQFLQTTEDSAKSILRNLLKAADLIKSFKQIAVDQSSEKKRHFNLKEYLYELFNNLFPQLKQSAHTLHITCPDNIDLYSYPGVFSQIITHLVSNTLTHGFEHTPQGTITLQVLLEQGHFTLNYMDNGVGMNPQTAKRLFEPFYTTKRGKGCTGLGMHVVYNLVTQSLGGHIQCQSQQGQGTSFTMTIPRT